MSDDLTMKFPPLPVDERLADIWERVHSVAKHHKKDSGEDVWAAIAPMLAEISSLEKEKHHILEADNARLRQWVDDLQSGMYVNCVYCGHRYGPKENTPVAMADILKEHISHCPQHPLAQANAKIRELRASLRDMVRCFGQDAPYKRHPYWKARDLARETE